MGCFKSSGKVICGLKLAGMNVRGAFGGRRTHLSLCGCGLKVAHPNQVVSRCGKGEHPAHPVHAAEASLALQRYGLHPPEYFLHPLPLALTDGITFVPRGPFVDGAAPVAIVLCYVSVTFSSRVAPTKPRVS